MIGDPSILSVIRKGADSVRVLPTFSFRVTENAARRKWNSPRSLVIHRHKGDYTRWIVIIVTTIFPYFISGILKEVWNERATVAKDVYLEINLSISFV